MQKKNEEHEQENDADADAAMDTSDDAAGQRQKSQKKNKDGEDEVMDFEREEAEGQPEGQDSELPEAALGERLEIRLRRRSMQFVWSCSRVQQLNAAFFFQDHELRHTFRT